MGRSLYSLAIARIAGTRTPRNLSPSPYSPFPVLKKRSECSATSAFAKLRSCFCTLLGIIRESRFESDYIAMNSCVRRSAGILGLSGPCAWKVLLQPNRVQPDSGPLPLFSSLRHQYVVAGRLNPRTPPARQSGSRQSRYIRQAI